MLRARVLGALEVELNGAEIDSPASQRPWAVFAYLALAPRPVTRGELASLFWPDVLDQSARASLRSALWVLRRRLGDAVAVDGERVGLRDEPGVWVDFREFERLSAGEDPAAALELCRGDLLEGLEPGADVTARAVDTRVTRLRRALNRCDGGGFLIKTLRGGGYALGALMEDGPDGAVILRGGAGEVAA